MEYDELSQAYLISEYSCVMIPPESLMAFLACSSTELGVSDGYETMTDFWTSTARAPLTAVRAVTTRVVNFIVLIYSDRSGGLLLVVRVLDSVLEMLCNILFR